MSVAFFQMIYQVLIGQERGPRFGSFAALYGIAETRALIDRALAGELRVRLSTPDRDRRSPSRGGGAERCPCRSGSARLVARPRHRGRRRQRAPSRCRPARPRHPACRGGSRRRASCGRPRAAPCTTAPCPAATARNAVRARTPHGQSTAVEVAGLVRHRRSRCRRSRLCSPSPRIGRRRSQPDDRGWCRPNRPA